MRICTHAVQVDAQADRAEAALTDVPALNIVDVEVVPARVDAEFVRLSAGRGSPNLGADADWSCRGGRPQ